MDAVQSEIAAIKRRFHCVVFENGMLTLNIAPTGDMPISIPALPCEVSVSADYPSIVCVPRIRDNDSLPPAIVKSLNLVWERYCSSGNWEGRPMLRHAFRWAENHLGETLSEIVDIQRTLVAMSPSLARPVASDAGAAAVAEVNPAPSVALPSASAKTAHPLRGPAALFAEAGNWTIEEHVAYESAVRDYFRVRGRRVTDIDAWLAVSVLVGRASAPGTLRSPAACAARYLLLNQLVKGWMETCVAPFRETAPILPAPALIPQPLRTLESVEDTDPGQDLRNRDASMQQASRRRRQITQPAGMHSAAMHKVPFPERRSQIGGFRVAVDGIHETGSEEEEEDDSDRKNPRHVRLYKFFNAKAAAAHGDDEEEEGEDEEGADNLEESEDEDEDNEDEGEGEGQEDDEDEDEEALLDDDDSHVATFTGLHLDPRHAGTLLGLDRASLFGIGTCAVTRVHVALQCQRCAVVVTANLAGVSLQKPGTAEADASPGPVIGAEAVVEAVVVSLEGKDSGSKPISGARVLGTEWRCWCPKCSLLLSASFRPTLLHDGSGCLGYVDVSQAIVSGLAGVWLAATCLECGASEESPRVAPPVTWETSCRHCYSRMRLEARGSVVQVASAQNALPAAEMAGRVARSAKSNQKFTVGKPLPDEGTCKHYKQSYRWLRFPCCDQAFPCDACHDDACDHPAEWAKRMVCGHCAREQPFSNATCVACGGSMRRSTKRTTFWEGGEGQRNKALLSYKDSHKHKNSSMKTRSKKGERVGKAGSGANKTNNPAYKSFERYKVGVGVETVIIKPKVPKSSKPR